MPEAPHNGSIKLKVCLGGEEAVGKTSLSRRLVYDIFEDRYVATLGTKIAKKVLEVRQAGQQEPVEVVLMIWDVMGDGGFWELLRDSYFMNAHGFLAVCDVTRPDTLSELEEWKEAVSDVAGRIPSCILANKADLAEEAQLGPAEVVSLSRKWGCPYTFTSAKTGENVQRAFQELAQQILRCDHGAEADI